MALSVVVVEELAEAAVGPFLAAESELDRDKSLAARWCRNIANLHQTNDCLVPFSDFPNVAEQSVFFLSVKLTSLHVSPIVLSIEHGGTGWHGLRVV